MTAAKPCTHRKYERTERVGDYRCKKCGEPKHPARLFSYRLSERVVIEAGQPVKVKRDGEVLGAFRGTFRYADPDGAQGILWITEDQAVSVTEVANGRKQTRVVLQTASWRPVRPHRVVADRKTQKRREAPDEGKTV